MRYGNAVKGVRPLAGYRLRVVFRDGFVGDIDLGPLFAKPRGPMTEPFQDPEFFKQAFVEGGVVTWPNQYDICPDVLRYYCEIGRVSSKEELEAAFSIEQTATSKLNEKHSPK